MFRLFLLFLLFQCFFIRPQVYCVDNKIHISGLKKFLDNFHSVESGVCYRSAQLSPKHLVKYIKKYGIKTVINLRGENRLCDWWNAEKNVSKKFGVALFNLNFYANRYEKKEDLKALLDIYKTAQRPILIHCLSGVDRTGEAAALWILEQKGGCKKDALKHLSLRYGYFRFRRPKKYFLVKNWCGVDKLKFLEPVS